MPLTEKQRILNISACRGPGFIENDRVFSSIDDVANRTLKKRDRNNILSTLFVAWEEMDKINMENYFVNDTKCNRLLKEIILIVKDVCVDPNINYDNELSQFGDVLIKQNYPRAAMVFLPYFRDPMKRQILKSKIYLNTLN